MASLVLAQPLIPAVAAMRAGAARDFLNQQLHHSPWHGLTKADVTFAVFVMLLGMMIPVSLRRHRSDGNWRSALYWKIFRRAALLFAMGVLYNGGFSRPWPEIRLAGVLQRLAVCYLICALIFVSVNKWIRYGLVPLILLGYWGVMALVPVPGRAAGDFSFDGNLAAWVDSRFLPGQALYGTWDPNGILTTIPAIASCLIGSMWADLLLSGMSSKEKLVWLVVGGLAAINLGVLWDLSFPINKNLWTSSYVVVTSGIGTLELAACYLIADILDLSRWLFPFIVIGRNLLAAYLIAGMIPLNMIVDRLVGGDVAAYFGAGAPLLAGLAEGALLWGILYWLYRHKIFIRI